MFFTNVKRDVPLGSPLGTGERYQPLYNLKTRLSPCNDVNTYDPSIKLCYPFEGFLYYRLSKFIDASFNVPTPGTWGSWYTKIWDLDNFLDFATARNPSWGITSESVYKSFHGGKWKQWVELIEPYMINVGSLYYYKGNVQTWEPKKPWSWWEVGTYAGFDEKEHNVYAPFYVQTENTGLKREYNRDNTAVTPMPSVIHWGEYGANYKGATATFGRDRYFNSLPSYTSLDSLPPDNVLGKSAGKVMPDLEKGLFMWSENQGGFEFTPEDQYNLANPLPLNGYETHLLKGRFAYIKIDHTYVYETKTTPDTTIRVHSTFRAISYPTCCEENRSIYLPTPTVGDAHLTIDLVIETFRKGRLLNTNHWNDLCRCDPIVWSASSSMANKYEHVLRPDEDMGLVDKPYIYQAVENPLVLDYYPLEDNTMGTLYLTINGVKHEVHANEYEIIEEGNIQLTEQKSIKILAQPVVVMDEYKDVRVKPGMFDLPRVDQPNVGDSIMPISVKLERFTKYENTLTTVDAYFTRGRIRIDAKPLLKDLSPQQYIRTRLVSGKYCLMSGHIITRPEETHEKALDTLYHEFLEFFRADYSKENNFYEDTALEQGRLKYAD